VNLFLDSNHGDEQRRAALYEGDLFVFSPAPAAMKMVATARELLERAFAPWHPTEAQHHISVEEFARVLGEVKPAFIHHPDCKRLIPELLAGWGADPSQVYFDVPRMRSAAAGDYMKTGIAFAFHPHRDTWYSASQAQINWWFPIYDIEPANAMAFYPGCFDRAVPNSSATYNYYRWNVERVDVARNIDHDTRVQPKISGDVDLGSELRVIAPVGGVIAFSGQQLHETVPNTTDVTRFSIDFRTVHRGDLEVGIGAPRSDAACTGTSLRDFRRCTDLERLPAEVIARYDDESALEYAEALVFVPGSERAR
jgi:hypothetical protein